MNMFIIGEPLLQHLYIVYDFENEQIKLGVNKFSEGSGVQIYKPGERPGTVDDKPLPSPIPADKN